MAVTALGYVGIQMRAPDEWQRVGEDILGFQSAVAADGAIRLKMDGAPFRYLIVPGEADRFLGAGWECAAEDYESLVAGLQNAGALLATGSIEECAERAVAAFVRAEDPSGNVFELFHGRSDDASAFVSPVEGLTFVADELGLGHAVLPAHAHAETAQFYESLLGFELSDDLTLPPPVPEAPEMRIRFLHAANPRHHSLALFNGPAPSGVVHLMTEMQTLDQVGRCLDRVKAAGLPITASLGRHSNDRMVSFYFLCPAGIPMEVGCDGLQLDWAEFTPTVSTVGDEWGHEYNFPE